MFLSDSQFEWVFFLCVFSQLSVATTTQQELPMLSERHGRSRTRGGWWWTAPVWEREVDASHVPPEVSYNQDSVNLYLYLHSFDLFVPLCVYTQM